MIHVERRVGGVSVEKREVHHISNRGSNAAETGLPVGDPDDVETQTPTLRDAGFLDVWIVEIDSRVAESYISSPADRYLKILVSRVPGMSAHPETAQRDSADLWLIC